MTGKIGLSIILGAFPTFLFYECWFNGWSKLMFFVMGIPYILFLLYYWFMWTDN